MRRFLLTVATAATALAGTACSDSTGIGGNIAGSYELRTINGQSLPVQLGSRIYEAGILDIDSDGSFRETLQFRTAGNPLSTQEPYDGFWEWDGSDIVLEYEDNLTYFGNRTSSNRIVVEDDEGNEWSYHRF